MNWGRVKTVLIAAFLVINLVLLIATFAMRNSATSVSSQFVSDTVSALAKNNITISKNLIPTANPPVRQIEAADAAQNQSAFAAKIGGMADSGGGSFVGESRSLSIESGQLKYTKRLDAPIDPQNQPNAAKQLFDEMGLATTYLYQKAALQSGTLSFGQRIAGVDVANSSVVVTFFQDRVEVSGRWLNQVSIGQDSAALVSAASTLLEFSAARKSAGVVRDVSICYYISGGSSGQDRILDIVVAWAISMDGGEAFYYNAETGAFVGASQ